MSYSKAHHLHSQHPPLNNYNTHFQYQHQPPPNNNYKKMSSRDDLTAIANSTMAAVWKKSIYDRINHQTYDLSRSINDMMKYTRYYDPNDSRLSNWRTHPTSLSSQHTAAIKFAPMTTLEGAHDLRDAPGAGLVGVLNFASATKPGGGFRTGAKAQEESIARSSSLYMSLESSTARPFYELHKRTDSGGFYSHAMIYTPNVAVFRDDDGGWLTPSIIEVVTSAAVNAKQVRTNFLHEASREAWIAETMRERMGRILALFEQKGIRNVVLGSFGTGVFQNDVSMVSRAWGELLHDPGARFQHSFDRVLFAIPDPKAVQQFEKDFYKQHSKASQQFGKGFNNNQHPKAQHLETNFYNGPTGPEPVNSGKANGGPSRNSSWLSWMS